MTASAQVMAGAPHGGAERFFERLCLALHRAGDAVLPVIRHDAERATLLRNGGVAPRQLAFAAPFDLFTGPRLRRDLQQFQPRVAVSWMNRATRLMPRGDWVHVGRLGGYYRLAHYRRCDHLVGNTRGIVDWLRAKGWPADRTHHLPNFSEDFSTTAPAPDVLADMPLLLGLGRLHSDKGFDTLLQALALVPGCRLAIAGDGPELSRLTALALRLGVTSRIHFLGWRTDPGALLRAADIFVCSSRIEPLGNMIIEAWSARTPVVALAARGPAELIRNGQDGLLTPLEDPAALAAAISRVLREKSLRADLAGAGRSHFEQAFAQPRVLATWREFLAGVRRPS